MMKLGRQASFCFCLLSCIWITACGGGSSGGGGGNGGGGNGGGGTTKTTPTVTVTPGSSSITTAQSLSVTVAVSGSSGTPTGSVTLTSGNYTSAATTLSNGSASISIPSGALAAASDTLAASYTPDTASSSAYNSASGNGSVTVNKATPVVTVTPGSQSITTTQSLTVTVAVSGGAGSPTASGSIVLTSGAYTSPATTLTSGTASITINAGVLAAGSDTLTANYTPDTAGSAMYSSASGPGSVTVNKATPAITVSPASQSITTAQTLGVTVAVSGGTGSPSATGSVVLSSGTYTSASTQLASGSATINISAGSLATGTDTLTATYTPDTASSSTYASVFGIGSVKVTAVTPTVTVSPGSSSTTAAQSLVVTTTVNGGTGNPTPTGSVTLTSGNYASSAVALSGGSAQINIPAGSLVAGSDTLAAAYAPDATSSKIYSSASGTATVTVDTSVIVNQSSSGPAVTNQILGFNLAAWYDWPANASSIISAFNGAGIKAIRWPGGSWSDDYHWGYQPGSSTLVASYMCQTASPVTGGWAGYSTFANFVSAIPLAGSYDLALTANYGTNEACTSGGDPYEAAAWVAAALNDGITVSHMTVGNEEYGSWEEDMHNKQHDPGTYAGAVSGASGYYSLIKADSPSTLVGVVVDANNSCCAAGWDSTVLSNAKGSYDFVEFHYYPQNPGSESDTFLVQQAAPEFTTNINTIKQELNTAGEPNTPIYVGEMGSVSSNPGKQSWSITQGLYAGQMLGEMMNDGISRATWWIGFGNCNGNEGNDSSSLYGWQNFGAYNVFSDGSGDTGPNSSPCSYGGNGNTIGAMSPTAIAFQLFSNVAVSGQHVLTPTVAGDTTDVRAYAATNPSGTALVLFNLNETTVQNVVVTLSNESNSPGVTEYTYDKEMYDYTNTSCATATTCTYDSNHTYSAVDWVSPTMTTLGSQALPLTLTLQPWSMNVVIIQ